MLLKYVTCNDTAISSNLENRLQKFVQPTFHMIADVLCSVMVTSGNTY